MALKFTAIFDSYSSYIFKHASDQKNHNGDSKTDQMTHLLIISFSYQGCKHLSVQQSVLHTKKGEKGREGDIHKWKSLICLKFESNINSHKSKLPAGQKLTSKMIYIHLNAKHNCALAPKVNIYIHKKSSTF